jgi:hypothetical protein
MDIVTRLEKDKPSFHWGGRQRWNAAPETLREIQRSVREGMRTLETGCGASTVVFATNGAKHTVVSPTCDEHERVASYLRQVGVDTSNLDFQAGFSDDVLPMICHYPERMAEWSAWFSDHLGSKEPTRDASADLELWKEENERSFDYIFLDGAHSFPYPIIDWHYSIRRLKIGGRLLLDDIPIPAVACVYRYMMTDPNWKRIKLLDDRAAVFELLSSPAPEDYTLQPYNRNPDYGFLPMPKRSYMVLAARADRVRHQLGDRMPGLREYWRKMRS